MSGPDGGAGSRTAVACLLAGLVLVVLDAAIANVALPAIARALNAPPADAVRVVTAYQAALVMALFPCAAAGDWLGQRRVYSAGVLVFAGASALCALAPSLPILVAARFVQGLGGAAIMALGVALLRRTVPERRIGAALGWYALAVALASAAGPSLGALLLALGSWPWLFAVGLPLAALVLVATRALPDEPGAAPPPDALSVGLNTALFGALVVGAELLTEQPAQAAALLGGGALAALALVRRERGRRAPLVPLDLLRVGAFRLSVLASLCCFVGQSAALVSLPFYLRERGLDALETGLVITPWPLMVALVAPLAGRLADRVSSGLLCALGAGVLALGLVSAALWPPTVAPGTLAPVLAVCGVGFGLFQVPSNRSMLLAAPRARSAAAGSVQSTARLSGQTLGGVLMTVLFTHHTAGLAPRLGLGLAAAAVLLAGAVSTLRAQEAVRAAEV